MSKRKPYKIATLVLVILLLASISWSVYSYLIIKKQSNTISRIEQIEQINSPLELQVVKQQMAIDSINRLQLDLKSKLDALAIYSDSAQGIFFEIQLGKFKQFSLDQYLDNLIELRQERQEDYNTILLARFKTIEEAEDLLQHLKKLGLRTAFIVGRADGQIIDKKQAVQLLE